MEQCLQGIMKMVEGGAIPAEATVGELIGLMQQMLQGAAQEGAPQGGGPAGLGGIAPQGQPQI